MGRQGEDIKTRESEELRENTYAFARESRVEGLYYERGKTAAAIFLRPPRLLHFPWKKGEKEK